jgi:hypothetical protein
MSFPTLVVTAVLTSFGLFLIVCEWPCFEHPHVCLGVVFVMVAWFV